MSELSAAEERDSPVVVPTNKVTLMEGVTSWKNLNNKFLVVDLQHTADPNKRSPEWIAEARAGSVNYAREYGSKWTIYEGKRVYPTYSRDRHCMTGSIYALKRARLVSGWDGGPTDVNLAWSLAIVDPEGPRVRFIDEYHADDGDAMDFFQVVSARLKLEWFKLGGFSLHVSDQACFTKSNIEKSSLADMARKFGFSFIPGEISFVKRRSGVETLLKQYDAFKVHERCVLIDEALGGGYVYPKVMGGVGGMYKETPLKNKFSHIANTIEYVCSRLSIAARQIPYEGKRLPAHSTV